MALALQQKSSRGHCESLRVLYDCEHVKIDVNPALVFTGSSVSSSAPAMASSFRISSALWDKIHHFASFPQTGGEFGWPLGTVSTIHQPPMMTAPLVSLQQMVQFGQNPSQGTLLRASQFLLGKMTVRAFQLRSSCLNRGTPRATGA